jgi:hypothetical protein
MKCRHSPRGTDGLAGIGSLPNRGAGKEPTEQISGAFADGTRWSVSKYRQTGTGTLLLDLDGAAIRLEPGPPGSMARLLTQGYALGGTTPRASVTTFRRPLPIWWTCGASSSRSGANRAHDCNQVDRAARLSCA